MRLDAMILVFWMLDFKPTFSLSSFTFIKRLFPRKHITLVKSYFVDLSNWDNITDDIVYCSISEAEIIYLSIYIYISYFL